ncbi:hypothetical protein [Neolewinella litorea]|uniref:Uncharacterized protein n=1 Tax=Neolewinella litorea TaxID=2562452 RepID=A0A4V3XKC5_9BACT|nr:hypothetical protein [Neolewinella litorea]THH36433.1 hypothetical protein E4021_15230 [Neolewinella litorea]
MFVVLITIVIALFLAMLFVNLYFRAKVLRAYRELVRTDVDFTAAQILSQRRMEEEIVTAYPVHAAAIRDFGNYLRRSIRMATVLLVLITLFGGILMYYRH